MAHYTAAERSSLAELLGEPLMVDDPLITVQQAAIVLDASTTRIRDMIHLGELTAHDHRDGRRAKRRLRLSDVLAQANQPPRISVTDAAKILSESSVTVHRLAGAGLLTWRGGPWPFDQVEVEQLARRRRRWLTMAQAATRQQVSIEHLVRLLEDGILGHTGDARRPVDRDQLDALR